MQRYYMCMLEQGTVENKTSAMLMIRHNAQLCVSSQCTVICFVAMHSDMFRHNA